MQVIIHPDPPNQKHTHYFDCVVLVNLNFFFLFYFVFKHIPTHHTPLSFTFFCYNETYVVITPYTQTNLSYLIETTHTKHFPPFNLNVFSFQITHRTNTQSILCV